MRHDAVIKNLSFGNHPPAASLTELGTCSLQSCKFHMMRAIFVSQEVLYFYTYASCKAANFNVLCSTTRCARQKQGTCPFVQTRCQHHLVCSDALDDITVPIHLLVLGASSTSSLSFQADVVGGNAVTPPQLP